MNYWEERIYKEGYRAQRMGLGEAANNYIGVYRQSWADGWQDALTDAQQRMMVCNRHGRIAIGNR